MICSVYDQDTGRVICELADDLPDAEALKHASGQPGNLAVFRSIGIPDAGAVWIEGGERWAKVALGQAAELSVSDLTATLSAGHVFGVGHGEVLVEDSYTFASPVDDLGIALDVVRDDLGEVGLFVFTWNPVDENKPDLPAGYTLIKADILRGVLPAGAIDLAELVDEEGS